MESEALPRARPGSERPGCGPLAGRRILYASTNHAWAFGWTFYQMLAEALAGRNEVVYVDTPTSLARLRPRRWGALLVAAAEREGRLDLLRAAGLPLQRSRWQRSAGGRLAARAVARWAARAGFDPDLVWTFSPWELPFVRRFGAATSVYWTADHLPFVPGERPLLERVDVILAAADPVYEALRARFGARVPPVPVACDFARPARAAALRLRRLGVAATRPRAPPRPRRAEDGHGGRRRRPFRALRRAAPRRARPEGRPPRPTVPRGASRPHALLRRRAGPVPRERAQSLLEPGG